MPVASGLLFQGFNKIAAGGYPAEARQNVVYGGILYGWRAARCRGIGNKDGEIIPVAGVPDSPFHTHVGRYAGKGQIFFIECLENGVQICAEEGTVPRFYHDYIVFQHLQAVYYFGTPGTTDEAFVIPFGFCLKAELAGLIPVTRIGATGLPAVRGVVMITSSVLR